MIASLTVASRFNSFGEFGLKNVATTRMHSSLKGRSFARGGLYCESDGAEDGAPDGLSMVGNDCCLLTADGMEDEWAVMAGSANVTSRGSGTGSNIACFFSEASWSDVGGPAELSAVRCSMDTRLGTCTLAPSA